ncbi:MAG: hypothetical protein ACP5OA_06075 [Candidatus Woesearchaeota archaeon]
MDFVDIINSIEDSIEFKDFILKHPHYYLVHVFRIVDNDIPSTWQIGYYSKDSDKIVVFEYNNGLVMMHSPEDALKQEEYIQQLDVSGLTLSHDNIIDIINEFYRENYKYDLLSKSIYLLQNLPLHGQVWNVTIITHNYSVINIKVDAISGNVVKHEKHNLMQWNTTK